MSETNRIQVNRSDDDSFRARIAKTLFSLNAGEDWNMDPLAWEEISDSFRECWFKQADVLIRELGLHREPGRPVPGVYIDPKTQGWVINPDAVEDALASDTTLHRYVTDWTTDE